MLPDISFHTNNRLNSFSIIEKDILVIIKSLDANKSHGWDNIWNKICGESLALPLKMIFEAASNDGVFQMIGRKVILYLFISRIKNFTYLLSPNKSVPKVVFYAAFWDQI